MNHRHTHTNGICICHIVPPYILEYIAQHGTPAQRAAALETLAIDEQIRAQRAALSQAGPSERPVIEAFGTPHKNRQIFTANNTFALPGTLVRSEGQGPSGDLAVDEAYDGLGATFDLYFDIYGRNSINNNGMDLIGTVHYGNQYKNAFWDGKQMVFGDGDGMTFDRFTIAIDVMGHELTHGVTQFEAGLVYHDQPGALNESISDVFGSLVKQRSLGQTAAQADWLIGAGLFAEDLERQGFIALRSLKAPGTANPADMQPDHMSRYVITDVDSHGVHINSGIPNKAFYLVAMALGGNAWDVAGNIWYKTLLDSRLPSTALFRNFATLTVDQANKHYGDSAKAAVIQAWKDVGINTENLVVGNFAYDAGGWRVDKHPRFLADLTADGRADIVGFGDAGVWVSLNNGDGTFQDPCFVVANFGYEQGWRVDKHPRFLADLTGNGCADIVGFGDAGVWVSLNNGDGSFQEPKMVVANFAYDAGGWRVDKHPRFLADLTGDGRADIVGFGEAGVWVSLNNGDGTFQAPKMVVANFAYDAGGWRVDKHPRFLADLTGDGRADIVGFGDAGVWVSLNNGDGTFQDPKKVIDNFAYDAGGWRVDKHPRFLADLTGDGRADIVGFGDAGVWVSLNQGNDMEPLKFEPLKKVVSNFAYDAGSWRVDKHPRFLADLTGDGRADIVGFGDAGVWVSLNNGDGTFLDVLI